ncbi:Crp/Fnr family transcriptional regulator [Hydrogenophaga sp.]|uniref:Crp/Fnr family transcriptional regulator n=1 Tax=Hydrogenophaga sp. TaxID=1904254 RepID=UPI0035B3BD29
MSTALQGPVRLLAGQDNVFRAGECGLLWRVVSGTVRLDRAAGTARLPVWLGLPGDLIGVEALCDQPYQFTASPFTDCVLAPVPVAGEFERQALLRQALFQQQLRSHDMATLRTGSVASRLACLLRLLGVPQGLHADARLCGDTLRSALPALRELAQMVDAKSETVCRALAQLLPPRSRRSGPARVHPVPAMPARAFAPWVGQPVAMGAMA